MIPMLDSLSVSGGDAGPSNAIGAGSIYNGMNSPFSVAGAGGKASANGADSAGGISLNLIALAVIGAVLLLVKMK